MNYINNQGTINMQILVKLTISLLLASVISALPVLAVETKIIQLSPYTVLENVGNKLFSRIAASQQEIKKFPRFMQVIVEEELMPSIDYRYASYRILGKHLRKTSKEQRIKFVDSMRRNLARTYANALMKYKNQQVIFESEKPIKDKKIVAVKTQIIDANKPTINVVFKMRQNKKTGEWKAFDMVVEGISLLSSKKAELGKKIAKQGVEQVTVELAALTKSH
jgi:phospholipid transport system substrate-binding protein